MKIDLLAMYFVGLQLCQSKTLFLLSFFSRGAFRVLNRSIRGHDISTGRFIALLAFVVWSTK
jgi:hypothetical protein